MATLDVLLEAVRLKALARAGWVRKGVSGPESVAAHTWGICWLVLVLLPEDLDRGRALAYATLHDLAEVRVGDLTPVDPVSKEEKARREHEAMRELCEGIGRRDLLELWEHYEAQADAEARFVRELDRLDMAVQALAYAESGAQAMEEFVASAERVVRHPALLPLMTEIRARIAR